MSELERLSDGTYVRHAEKTADSSGDRIWYDAEDPHASLWSLVKSLKNRQNWRRQSDDLALRLYSDMRYVGYSSVAGNTAIDDILDTRIGENVIRAITRALNSKLARRRSRPFVVTNDADFEQRMTAQSLERWILGKLRQQRADEQKFPMFRLHALTFGTGCIRTYWTLEKGACMEVIPTNEITVDECEAKYGDPPNVYITRTVSLSQLKHDYPDKLEVLKGVATGSSAFDGWGSSITSWDRDQSSDICVVVEAYHRGYPGRHVIACSNGILLDEPWEREELPFIWMRRELRPLGFWGIGVPEDLAPTQIDITANALAQREITDLLANPYWLVERGMKVTRSSISTLIGRVMEWTSTGSGFEPKLVSQPVVPPDIWTRAEALKKTAFETSGVSQLTAQMLKPAGLDSGKALRAYNEMESELLSDLMNEHDFALLKVCYNLIEEQMECAKELKRRKAEGEDVSQYKQTVTYVGKGSLEKIDWNEVDLKDDLDNFIIEILPASAMASTLSARIEDVEDMNNLGLFADAEPEEVWEYLDMPDRRRIQRKKSTPRRLLERIIEIRIVKNGEDVNPEPTWDLATAIDMSLEMIKELELYENAPEDRLELLRRFILKCKAIMDRMAGASAATQNVQDLTNVLSSDPSGAGAGLPPPDLGEAPQPPLGAPGAPDLGAGPIGPVGPAGAPGQVPAG